MLNPILQAFGGRAQNAANDLFNSLIRTNPQFERFVKQNQGKTAEQIAKEYNINLNDIYKYLK